ncbi:protein ORF32 [Cyprinid herpesvirus 3]|uniref:Isolate HZ419 ORF32 protein n=1 Tax=Cyprinid herpesvirus 3 TaxID=180230 RepID=A3QMK1_CYHV3|nr:unnamed protein product [Cyprinid herpesvirus 3]ABC55211.1 hypothetical protein [Cyprinid herpesvirus 3]ABG42860.1 protein ORF32 [Cyprinid herpesvirus 3]AIC32387.1 ORF32R [Cyprinid herpesvirus 3]AJK93599.1 ORF32 [Cyprinid herpesvirus 3]AJP55522.1 protein ORF32 [Cyprinid herpesvirus 3]
MERFILLIVGAVLFGVYIQPVSILRQMWLDMTTVSSTGKAGGCNSTAMACKSNDNNANSAVLKYAYLSKWFDLDNGWGYTFLIQSAEVSQYNTFGVLLNGRPCETQCQPDPEDSNKYYCTSSKSKLPNVKGACAILGKDWYGNVVPTNATWQKDRTSGVFEWRDGNNTTWVATHPPLCVTQQNAVYICALDKP